MASDTTADLFGLIEEKGIGTVKLSEAHGKPRAVFGLWMAANIEFGALTTGALATGAFGLSATAAFLAILLANVIGGVLVGILSTFGVEYGLPQMIQGEKWFGKIGNKLPALFNFIGGFSWFAVNTVIGAYAIQYFLGINLIICILALSVVQVAIAFVGHDLIQAAEKYFFYLLVIIFAALTYVAVSHLGLAIPANVKSMAAVGGPSGAFILTTSVMVGFIVSWGPYASDYTRYLRTDKNTAAVKKAVFGYAAAGNLIGCLWIEFLGAIIGASVSFAKPSDLFTSWMPDWLKAPLLIAVIIGTISANIVNIYSATLSALALGVKIKQHWASIISGVCGTIISILTAQNFISNYENFLFVLGYWSMPWIAISILSHATSRTSRLPLSASFAAWIATMVLSVPFWNQTLYTGWFATNFPQFGDSTFVVSFILGGILYLALSKPAAATVALAAE